MSVINKVAEALDRGMTIAVGRTVPMGEKYWVRVEKGTAVPSVVVEYGDNWEETVTRACERALSDG